MIDTACQAIREGSELRVSLFEYHVEILGMFVSNVFRKIDDCSSCVGYHTM